MVGVCIYRWTCLLAEMLPRAIRPCGAVPLTWRVTWLSFAGMGGTGPWSARCLGLCQSGAASRRRRAPLIEGTVGGKVSAAHRSIVACISPLVGGRCEEDWRPEAWPRAWTLLRVIKVFTAEGVVALGEAGRVRYHWCADRLEGVPSAVTPCLDAPGGLWCWRGCS